MAALVAVTTISESNLNDFTSVTKPRIGRGYGLINAPWSGGSIVEYIPYGSDGSIMGIQRITSVVPVNGVYQSAYRALNSGTWSAWVVDSPLTDLKRFVLNNTVDFNQFAITQDSNGKYTLHFYKNGTRVGGIVSA